MSAHGIRPVVRVIASAAPPVLHIQTLLDQVQAAGWSPHLIATPTAATWLHADGGPVVSWVSRMPMPGEDLVLSDPALVVAAPATFNTINRWAAGVNDTLALGLLNEALGARLPIVAAPHVNSALAGHPAYQRNLALLRQAGVRIAGDGTPCPGGCHGAAHWTDVIACLPEPGGR